MDPFFTTKPPGKGTGLGLAIVSKAVIGAKGLLEVDSRPGDGTTFNLYLPRANASEAGPAVEESDATGITSGSGRFLLVDDEEFVLASGYLDDSERILIEQFGTTILQKPFELEEGTQAVADHLSSE